MREPGGGCSRSGIGRARDIREQNFGDTGTPGFDGAAFTGEDAGMGAGLDCASRKFLTSFLRYEESATSFAQPLDSSLRSRMTSSAVCASLNDSLPKTTIGDYLTV